MTPDPPVASAAALDGLTVIDLSPTRVGAQVSQVLADFGADVLWIEPPGGSALRDQPAFPFFARESRASSSTSNSAAIATRCSSLARDADVLIETFRPGVADRLGLGFERLAADNPRIVYASITGFGRTGPYASREGLRRPRHGEARGQRRLPRDERGAPRPPFVDTPVVLVLGIADGAARHPRGAVRARAQRARPAGRSEPGPGLRRARHVGMVPPPDRRAVARRRTRPSPVFDDDGVPASPFPYMLLNPLTKDGRWLQFAQVRPHLFVAFDAGARPRVDADRPGLGRHPGVRGCRTPPRALGEDARGRGREDARRVGGDLRRRSRRLRRAVPPRPRGPRPSPARPRRSGRRDRASRASGVVRQPGPLVQMAAHTRLGAPSRPELGQHRPRTCASTRRSAPPPMVAGDAPATFRSPGSRCSSWRSCTPHRSARRCSPTSAPGSSRWSRSTVTRSGPSCRSPKPGGRR